MSLIWGYQAVTLQQLVPLKLLHTTDFRHGYGSHFGRRRYSCRHLEKSDSQLPVMVVAKTCCKRCLEAPKPNFFLQSSQHFTTLHAEFLNSLKPQAATRSSCFRQPQTQEISNRVTSVAQFHLELVLAGVELLLHASHHRLSCFLPLRKLNNHLIPLAQSARAPGRASSRASRRSARSSFPWMASPSGRFLSIRPTHF